MNDPILELVILHAKKRENNRAFPNFRKIEKCSNALTKFYKKSSKRSSDLLDFLKTKNIKPFVLILIFKVRWVDSHFQATSRIIKHWSELTEHLARISKDKKFDKKTHKLAKESLAFLTDKHFLSTVTYLLDIQEVLSGISREFQTRAASIIGQRELRQKLVDSLIKIRNEEGGRFTKALLKRSKCQQWGNLPVYDDDGTQWAIARQRVGQPRTCHYLLRYERDDVSYLGRRLTVGGFAKFSEFRDEFMNRLLALLQKYMPEAELVSDMMVLDQRSWLLDDLMVHLQTPGQKDSLQRIAKKMNMLQNFDEIYDSWRTLLTRLNEEPYLKRCSTAASAPEDYWLMIIYATKNLNPSFVKFIYGAISIALSSAEAERGFKDMNDLHAKRWLLSPTSLQGLMHIRRNGPEIHLFDPQPYTKIYLQKNFLRCDSIYSGSTRRGVKRRKKTECEDFSDTDEEEGGPRGGEVPQHELLHEEFLDEDYLQRYGFLDQDGELVGDGAIGAEVEVVEESEDENMSEDDLRNPSRNPFLDTSEDDSLDEDDDDGLTEDDDDDFTGDDDDGLTDDDEISDDDDMDDDRTEE